VLRLKCFTKFKEIRPLEFYNQGWNQPNKKALSPNLVDLISNFNRLSNWVISEIVSNTNLRKRVQVLKHFIAIGYATYSYKDYETTFMITLSLSHSVISRLSETWASLDGTATKQWNTISEFTSFKNNYKNYRDYIGRLFASSKTRNVMPYIGLYLKDLTFIEQNENFDGAGAVNFYKMRMVAAVISDIQKAQQSNFNFKKKVDLLSYLTYGLLLHDEDTIWKLSMKCEANSTVEPNPLPSLSIRLFSAKEKPIKNTFSNPVYGLKDSKKKS